MDEKMSLQDVRDWLLSRAQTPEGISSEGCANAAKWITAHLTQPAQAVDVGAIREVIAELSNPSVLHAPYVTRCADKLTAALPNANGKEW